MINRAKVGPWDLLDLLLRAVAVVVAVALALIATRDISRAWDVWAYHMPFAARLAGIVGPATYEFSPAHAARFAGFPLLGETLQGLLWRLTGRPEAANLVALGSLYGLVAFLSRVFGAPLHTALLALVAIPLVMIHATAAYVDLLANACVTMLLLLVWRSLADRGPGSIGTLVAAACLAAAAVNTKYQLIPIVLMAWLILSARALSAPRRGAALAVGAGALPLILATPVKNTILHRNPIYPVAASLLGKALPGAEQPYVAIPIDLREASRPVRFLASAFEVGTLPITSGRRWTIDQWASEDSPAFRMGGLFGAYVALNLVALSWAMAKRPSRTTLTAGAMVALAMGVASVMPQSHEQRYYMFWMLLLVSVNVTIWSPSLPVAAPLVACAALTIVAWGTRGEYLYRAPESFEALVRAEVDTSVVRAAPPGGTICIAVPQWTFLYAAPFHGKTYRVQEATRPEDCESGGARPGKQ